MALEKRIFGLDLLRAIAIAYNPWWRWRLEKGYFMAWFLSFLVSAAIYYLFERPITHLRDRFGGKADRVSV